MNKVSLKLSQRLSIPVLATVSFSLLLSGCFTFNSKLSFTGYTPPPQPQGPSNSGSGPNPSGSATPDPNFDPSNPQPTPLPAEDVIRSIKPVLAVRGMACLGCHGDIRANVISDFGYGDSVYMGGPNSSGRVEFTTYNNKSSWYTNLYNSLQSARIQGNLYVPNVQVPSATLASLTRTDRTTVNGAYSNVAWPASINLPDFLMTPYLTSSSTINWWSGKTTVTGTTMPTSSSAAYGIQPPDTSIPPVVGLEQVVIRAPLESEIAALAPDLFASPDAGVRVKDPRSSGFFTVSNRYVTNVKAEGNSIKCYGDVVIKGPLQLKGVTIETDDKGCRLYVSGSVFIENAVQFVSDGGTYLKQNLQISSARAIIFAMTRSVLNTRLSTDRPWSRNGNWSDRSAEILADYDTVGTMVDGSTFDSVGGVKFSRMLLNAPVVHSRYNGQFQGVIVAEMVLFRLYSFNFAFDEAFSGTPILPLLKTDILVAK